MKPLFFLCVFNKDPRMSVCLGFRTRSFLTRFLDLAPKSSWETVSRKTPCNQVGTVLKSRFCGGFGFPQASVSKKAPSRQHASANFFCKTGYLLLARIDLFIFAEAMAKLPSMCLWFPLLSMPSLYLPL